MKKNNSDQYESIQVQLDPIKHPIAFQKKVKELIESGLTKEEAEIVVRTTPIELELYYEENSGLFGVEAEAIDGGASIYSPYSGEEMDDADEI